MSLDQSQNNTYIGNCMSFTYWEFKDNIVALILKFTNGLVLCMSFEQRDWNSSMQYFFYDGKQWYGVPTYLLAMTHHINNVNSEFWWGIHLICCFSCKNFITLWYNNILKRCNFNFTCCQGLNTNIFMSNSDCWHFLGAKEKERALMISVC